MNPDTPQFPVWPSSPKPCKNPQPYWTFSLSNLCEGKARLTVSEYIPPSLFRTDFWVYDFPDSELPNLPPIPELREWIKTKTRPLGKGSASKPGSSISLEDLGL